MIPNQPAPQKPAKTPQAKKKPLFRRFLLAAFLVLVVLGLIAALAAVGGYQYKFPQGLSAAGHHQGLCR